MNICTHSCTNIKNFHPYATVNCHGSEGPLAILQVQIPDLLILDEPLAGLGMKMLFLLVHFNYCQKKF